MTDTDEKFMREAIAEAKRAAADEVPVGCVIVRGGELIARAANEKETRALATAHAEMLAIERASAFIGNWYLEGCTLYVTLEPCAMCAGAVVAARVDRVVFGAYDKRFGACGTLLNIADNAGLNHRARVTGGVLQEECAALLSDFFKSKR
jgi:tRNA(adenine34) deaminase